jgi:ABC-type branched-subunit amino acid transport system ATPase component
MSVPLLEIKGIKVRYSGLPVLHGLSLSVNAGETVCVVGANGAGKSTILRAIMGAQRAFEGQIFFAGRIKSCAPGFIVQVRTARAGRPTGSGLPQAS